jgi:GT2 family glycosyltransferase
MCSERHPLPLVSVVIPTYQREKILCNTLEALFRQDYKEYEIIVIDQTLEHSPETVNFLEENHRRIRYLTLKSPSLPTARNVGILQSQGEIVLFVDDDTIAAKHFISFHVSAYENDVGGVAGQVIQRGGDAVVTSEVGRLDPSTNVTWNFNSTVPTDVMYATGGNMSFRRNLLLKVGLFEERFGGSSYFEDTDISLRISKLGYRIKFEPRATLIHLGGSDGGCGNQRRNPGWYYWYLHNNTLLALRHRSRFNIKKVVKHQLHEILLELRDPPLLALWLLAIPHACLSYISASLIKNN